MLYMQKFSLCLFLFSVFYQSILFLKKVKSKNNWIVDDGVTGHGGGAATS